MERSQVENKMDEDYEEVKNCNSRFLSRTERENEPGFQNLVQEHSQGKFSSSGDPALQNDLPKPKVRHVQGGRAQSQQSRDESPRNVKQGEVVAEDRKFTKLRNLTMLYEQGFILKNEFEERRSQLVDELTGTQSYLSEAGTSCSQAHGPAAGRARSTRRKTRVSSSIVVPRPPPVDFSVVPAERAIKHIFCLESRSWRSEEVFVRIDDTPFARGGLRLVYHMEEVSREDYLKSLDCEAYDAAEYIGEPSTLGTGLHSYLTQVTYSTTTEQLHAYSPQPLRQVPTSTHSEDHEGGAESDEKSDTKAASQCRTSYVAKIAIDSNEDPSTYFRDVEAQAHCARYAKLFNSYNPPRAVEFVNAWILELTERQYQPLCAIERFIPGRYKKHNNNYGFVSEDERNTPQAFSHFTLEASAHSLLVVDIQGVGDRYTDPQIHCLNANEYGKGNLGVRGFKKFLSTHKCNSVCRYLKLPPVNPNYSLEGTMPANPFMPATKINRRQFHERHAFEATPELRNLIKAKAKEQRHQRIREESVEPSFWDSHTEEAKCNLPIPFLSCHIL
mmetsp:Transcript_461/g.846  ORF Transcript_461/g.846 Transcript_461/m.846 type:complete len:558 (-) Transcript_461:102-1775(-)